MTDALHLEMQARWEVEGCRRAVERYREAGEGKALADMPAGRLLMVRAVRPLAEGLKALQEMAASPTAADRNTLRGLVPILLVEPERLAVLTLSACLRVTLDRPPDGGFLGRVARIADAAASALRWQIEFDRWAASTSETSLVAALERQGQLDTTGWRRLRRKLRDVDPEVWVEEQRMIIGGALIETVLTTLPQFFAASLRSTGNGVRTERCLELTPEMSELMLDKAVRAEIARPIYMPMLIPPLDWRYEPCDDVHRNAE